MLGADRQGEGVGRPGLQQGDEAGRFTKVVSSLPVSKAHINPPLSPFSKEDN